MWCVRSRPQEPKFAECVRELGSCHAMPFVCCFSLNMTAIFFELTCKLFCVAKPSRPTAPSWRPDDCQAMIRDVFTRSLHSLLYTSHQCARVLRRGTSTLTTFFVLSPIVASISAMWARDRVTPRFSRRWRSFRCQPWLKTGTILNRLAPPLFTFFYDARTVAKTTSNDTGCHWCYWIAIA